MAGQWTVRDVGTVFDVRDEHDCFVARAMTREAAEQIVADHGIAERLAVAEREIERLREAMERANDRAVKSLKWASKRNSAQEAWELLSVYVMEIRDLTRAALAPATEGEGEQNADCGCPSRVRPTRTTTHTAACTAKRRLANIGDGWADDPDQHPVA